MDTLTNILRHPMYYEPIVAPRILIGILGSILAAFGLELTVVDAAATGSVAEAVGNLLQYLIPVLFAAWTAQGYKARAQTNSPATNDRLHRADTADHPFVARPQS